MQSSIKITEADWKQFMDHGVWPRTLDSKTGRRFTKELNKEFGKMFGCAPLFPIRRNCGSVFTKIRNRFINTLVVVYVTEDRLGDAKNLRVKFDSI